MMQVIYNDNSLSVDNRVAKDLKLVEGKEFMKPNFGIL